VTHVLGFDISTVRVDCAAVPLLEQPRLGTNIQLANHPVKGSPKNPAERCIQAGRAARECLHVMHARGLEITAIAIEEPFGASRRGDRALLPILGSITAQLDAYPIQWWAPAVWRKEIGCRRPGKDAGHGRVRAIVDPEPCEVCGLGMPCAYDTEGTANGCWSPSGDALDAIGVALALRSFLNAHEEAA
jgi:hypothetical protein